MCILKPKSRYQESEQKQKKNEWYCKPKNEWMNAEPRQKKPKRMSKYGKWNEEGKTGRKKMIEMKSDAWYNSYHQHHHHHYQCHHILN